MSHYNTLGNGLKRGLLRFSEKISKGFYRPERRFVAEMIFGMAASGSCKLTEIGRALKEDIALKKTTERLGRNLADFSDREALMDNYLAAIRPSLGEKPMLLIDRSDVTKPCSPKMEAIGTVYDASEDDYGDGYWTMGAVALTEENHQPIPVYENLYPCKAQGGLGEKAEALAALANLRKNFGPNCVRVFDRGFDSGAVMEDLVAGEEHFIIRQNQNRVAVHHGRKTKIEDIVKGLECTDTMRFHSKTGNVSQCEIGMTQVTLPNLGNLKLRLVVCKNFGKQPLVLYTNLDESLDTLAVRIVKVYLMRWRIEEFYAFKKQEMHFEDFRVRRLDAIKTLDLLLTITCGYIGTLCAKAACEPFVAQLISLSRRVNKFNVFLKTTKFFFYAVRDGIACALNRLLCGISSFFCATPPSSRQLRFPCV